MNEPIAVRERLSYDSFAEEFLWPRRPVVVRAAAADSPAVRGWSLPWLREHFGDRSVRIDTGGEIALGHTGEFIAQLMAGAYDSVARPPYLRNASLLEFYPELIADVQVPAYCRPNWLESNALRKFIPPVWTVWIELFVSAANTRFPRVHVDSSLTHAWIIQVSGRKRLWLWPPQPQQPLYSIHSAAQQKQRGLDCIGADLEHFFAHSRPLTAELDPGDFVFIPTGFWHTAESLTRSISLSGNFVNDSNWDEFCACWFTGLRHVPELQSIAAFSAQTHSPLHK